MGNEVLTGVKKMKTKAARNLVKGDKYKMGPFVVEVETVKFPSYNNYFSVIVVSVGGVERSYPASQRMKLEK